MSTPQSVFLMSVLCLFALTVAWLLCKGVAWLYRKCFHDPEDDYEL